MAEQEKTGQKIDVSLTAEEVIDALQQDSTAEDGDGEIVGAILDRDERATFFQWLVDRYNS